jgi:urease accessory protein
MTRRGIFVVALLAALLLPGRAEAHLVNTGFGPFYDGISHLFVTAQDLLAVIALALLAGLSGKATSRTVIFSATGAWAIGGWLGVTLAPDEPWLALATPGFFVLGALVAADRDLSRRLVAALAIGVGLIHGFLNGAEAAASRIGLVGLAGSVSALFVLLVLVAAAGVSLAPTKARVVLRVAGSWIAAIGLLMLGWAFRPQP